MKASTDTVTVVAVEVFEMKATIEILTVDK
jgi:hypothetical protein